MSQPIYVIGHKNPDTDSIVSAIAYAEYKKIKGVNAVAARVGGISSETESLLERFSFEDPIRMYSAKSTLKEIDMDKPISAFKDLTMKQALDKVLKLRNRGLVVTDKNKKLEGMVTLDDLTYMWTKSDDELEKIIKTIELKNVLKILQGELVVEGNSKLSGKMHIFPSLKSNVEDGSIVLLRNEDDKIQYCLQLGATLFIIVTSSPISKKIIKMAKDANVTIVTTELSPLTVTRLIYQIPSIEHIMIRKIDYFNINDTVEEASKHISKSRHRSYPVLDDDGCLVGSISRYHLFNYEKKKFILVDHNEKKQVIDDIDSAEIIEIVDHHRMGGFACDNPINIKISSVGATSTLIAKMFFDDKIKLPNNLAGLLLGGIVADTMNLKSPTTTKLDIDIACKLEKISKVKANELSKMMIDASDSLLDKRYIQIVYDDFKEFNIDGNKVGISQVTFKSKAEYLKIKDGLKRYLEDCCKSQSYDLMVMMLTNPNGSGSYLIKAGNKAYLLKELFAKDVINGFTKNLVSRKKQLLPEIIKVIGGK